MVFHEVDQGPEGFFRKLDVIEQIGCDEVHTLDVADFLVIDTVAEQNFPEPISKPLVPAESWVSSICPVYILVYLHLVLMAWVNCQ